MLINCPECKKEISTDARKCPACGANNAKRTGYKECVKCKKPVHSSQKVCECGAKNPGYINTKAIGIGCGTIVLIFFLIGLIGKSCSTQSITADMSIKETSKTAVKNKVLSHTEQVNVLYKAYDNLSGSDMMWSAMLDTNTYNPIAVRDILCEMEKHSDNLGKIKFDKNLLLLNKTLKKGYSGLRLYYGNWQDNKDVFKLGKQWVKESLKKAKKQLSAVDPAFKFSKVVRVLEKKKAIPKKFAWAKLSGNMLNVRLYATLSKLKLTEQKKYKSILTSVWYMIDKDKKTKIKFTTFSPKPRS